MMGMSRLMGGLGLSSGLLIAGILLGISLERMWLSPDGESSTNRPRRHQHHKPPPPPAKRMLRQFQGELELTTEQSQQVEQILEDIETKAQVIQKDLGPRMQKLMEGADQEIQALLNNAQVLKYDELVKERTTRMVRERKRWDDRPPRPPGPRSPHGNPILERFDEIDSDGDGKLSPEELRIDFDRRPRPF